MTFSEHLRQMAKDEPYIIDNWGIPLLEWADKFEQIEAENERLRRAIFDERYDGKERLAPVHFEMWAKQIRKQQSWNSELTSLLDRLAALEAGGE